MLKKIILSLLLVFAVAKAGAQLPNVVLTDINGKTVSTGSLNNEGKPFILSFFELSCKPCMRELNAIAEVYEEWQEETGVKLVAVSLDQGANSLKVKPYANSKGWEYEVLLDKNNDFKRAMNVTLLPTVFIIDKNGKTVYQHTGYSEGFENEIIKKVKECL